MTDALQELRARLNAAVGELRAGEIEPEQALAVIEECARLAGEAAAAVDASARAVVEPLPDLPGQLPLPAIR